MKIRKYFGTRGFSLVELIVITFILVTISVIIVGVVYSVLRGSSRSHTTLSVSSSGNYALSVISSLIISSEDVLQVGGNPVSDCTSQPSGDSIQLSTVDGGVTTLACRDETISSNGASLIDNFELRVVPGSCSFECRQSSAFDAPIIEIDFSLESRTNSYPTDQIQEHFQSSAVLRNFSY